MSKTSKILADLVESFFRSRLAMQQHASPATIAAYRDSIRLLLVFASNKLGKTPSRLTLPNLDRDLILAFLEHLETQRCNSVRTRNIRLTAVRSFFQHVVYSDPEWMGIAQRILSTPKKRTKRKLLGYLERDELQDLLAAPDRSAALGRRDYAILLFLSTTGARVTETIGVNIQDVRFDIPSQVTLQGKGSKQRVVPVAADHVAILRKLCAERNAPTNPEAPVFVNARGHRLSRFGITYIVRRAAQKAAQQRPQLAGRTISPHTLRHTAAMHLLQAGVDLTTIRSWLGHVSLDTTHHYIEADVEMKRQALEKCNAVEATSTRYQPSDKLLAILEAF